ncbi:protein-disulfide reductase DsbD [Bermanella marisrubri]|uniref:Thiol:disulfide interchange protein n=1 Tax=Bermanella marisrubri TaxID=207949 RepID=Q1MZT9_9GAMM|nr:protein-disulfide reductase DsbD [Bermanella marisrubri]EAT11468.1 Thiol:disulfide interchange protein [Oceanobacter sp. RED65] [Bermanella marisrubri]QIZ85045.1 protein-disulfide reductase DsbD [Bermanella marisrubri]
MKPMLNLLLRPVLLFSLMLMTLNSYANLFGSSALPANEAIQFSTEQRDSQLAVQFELADNIYLYQDKIKLSFADKTTYSHFGFEESPVVIEDPAFGKVAVFYEQATLLIDRSKLPAGTESLTMKYQGCDEAIGLCYPPQKAQLDITPASKASKQASVESASNQQDLNSAKGISGFLENASATWVILTFLLLGIGLTFTPCVLPMVPILSSVIAGQNNLTPSKGFVLSTTYVLGMAITFAIAGVIVGMLGARFNIQAYMQQSWVLAIFAGLFVLLALSMFGFYELRLPRFIQDPLNRLNEKQEGGSLVGVFFMGVLSAIVVSPCVTAPLAGALVYISTTGDAVLGGSALLALGLGMGVPLIIIGTTGASLLPKAGMWMEQVKHFFGVLLLAVAWWVLGRVLPEWIYLSGWVILAGIYGVVLGAFEPAHSQSQRVIKGFGLLLVGIALSLMIKLIVFPAGIPSAMAVQNSGVVVGQAAIQQKQSDRFFQTIYSQAELSTAVEKAQQNNQLVFVDMYADWCIECKIMAKTLFTDPEVQAKLDPFVRIKFDITDYNDDHKAYLESQIVFGPPALIFYGFNGQAIDEAKILGEISKKDFLNHLDQFDP